MKWKNGRPFPFMIERAMKLTATDDPQKVCKVGDTPTDLLEGENARCGYNIAVTNGTHDKEELKKYPHTHLIDSLSELTNVLI